MITFCVTLSSQFVEYFENKGVKPVVELRSERRAWRKHLGMNHVLVWVIVVHMYTDSNGQLRASVIFLNQIV